MRGARPLTELFEARAGLQQDVADVLDGPRIQLAERHLQQHAVEGGDQIHVLQAVRQGLSEKDQNTEAKTGRHTVARRVPGSQAVGVPDVGPFWNDPLPATEHRVLHRRQQEAFRRQLQHGVDALQPHLGPHQLRSSTFNRFALRL